MFARTSILRASAVSPLGKPQAVGGECATDNSPQPIPVSGSPRTTFPSPMKGRNRGSLQQDTCSLSASWWIPDARLLEGEGIKRVRKGKGIGESRTFDILVFHYKSVAFTWDAYPISASTVLACSSASSRPATICSWFNFWIVSL